MKILLQEAVTKAASSSGTPFVFGPLGCRLLRQQRWLVVTLDITQAERDSSNELYDFYITTGDGVAAWDICHFAQIASSGAKRFTARISLENRPENVTNASPGVAENDPSILTTTASGTHDIKTLGAGLVRHGPIGDRLNHELVVAGTVATGISYSITAEIH